MCSVIESTVSQLSPNNGLVFVLKEVEKTHKNQLELKRIIRLVKNEKEVILYELKKYQQLFDTYNQLQNRLVQLLNKNQQLSQYKLNLFTILRRITKQLNQLKVQTNSESTADTPEQSVSSSAEPALKPLPLCLQKQEIQPIVMKQIPKFEFLKSELEFLPDLPLINRYELNKSPHNSPNNKSTKPRVRKSRFEDIDYNNKNKRLSKPINFVYKSTLEDKTSLNCSQNVSKLESIATPIELNISSSVDSSIAPNVLKPDISSSVDSSIAPNVLKSDISSSVDSSIAPNVLKPDISSSVNSSSIAPKVSKPEEELMSKKMKLKDSKQSEISVNSHENELKLSEEMDSELKEENIQLNRNKEQLNRTVLVTGLAASTTEEAIRKLGSGVGAVDWCRVEKTGYHKSATVCFVRTQDAQTFRKRFDRTLLELSVIRVSIIGKSYIHKLRQSLSESKDNYLFEKLFDERYERHRNDCNGSEKFKKRIRNKDNSIYSPKVKVFKESKSGSRDDRKRIDKHRDSENVRKSVQIDYEYRRKEEKTEEKSRKSSKYWHKTVDKYKSLEVRKCDKSVENRRSNKIVEHKSGYNVEKKAVKRDYEKVDKKVDKTRDKTQDKTQDKPQDKPQDKNEDKIEDKTENIKDMTKEVISVEKKLKQNEDKFDESNNLLIENQIKTNLNLKDDNVLDSHSNVEPVLVENFEQLIDSKQSKPQSSEESNNNSVIVEKKPFLSIKSKRTKLMFKLERNKNFGQTLTPNPSAAVDNKGPNVCVEDPDECYRKKLLLQQKLREELLRQKEERRKSRQIVVENSLSPNSNSKQLTPNNSCSVSTGIKASLVKGWKSCQKLPAPHKVETHLSNDSINKTDVCIKYLNRNPIEIPLPSQQTVSKTKLWSQLTVKPKLDSNTTQSTNTSLSKKLPKGVKLIEVNSEKIKSNKITNNSNSNHSNKSNNELISSFSSTPSLPQNTVRKVVPINRLNRKKCDYLLNENISKVTKTENINSFIVSKAQPNRSRITLKR